jgi:hypothetical protein
MPVPGYDPEDLDDVLEARIDERHARRLLSEDEWAAYREGESLVDLLDESEIRELLGDEGERTDGE